MIFSLIPTLLTFAQAGPRSDEFAGFLGLFVCFGFALIAMLCFWGLICWLIVTPLSSLPEEYRVVPTGHVWLLLIPCFNMIWNFFVYPRVAQSFQRYFGDSGISHEYGDCGEQIGLWYCICVVSSVIPLLNYLTGPASLVLLIIYLVKIWGLKGEVDRGVGSSEWREPEMDI